jgi:hypothetical protein
MIASMTTAPYPVLVPELRYYAIWHTYSVPPRLMAQATLGLVTPLRVRPCRAQGEAHALIRKATGATIQMHGQ